MMKETIGLKGSTRKYLRALAHHQSPAVWVGKKGLTEPLVQKVDDALSAHELIKVRFLEFFGDIRALSEAIQKQTRSEIVSMIGHTVILYRQHPEPEKRKIRLPAE
jgi:RNA-binding protein